MTIFAETSRSDHLKARTLDRPRAERAGHPVPAVRRRHQAPAAADRHGNHGQDGYGAGEDLARSLGLITIVCTVLYALPPTSILGAILLTGYLGGAIASHVRIDSPCSATRCSGSISA